MSLLQKAINFGITIQKVRQKFHKLTNYQQAYDDSTTLKQTTKIEHNQYGNTIKTVTGSWI